MAAPTISDTRIGPGFTYEQAQASTASAMSSISAAIGRLRAEDPEFYAEDGGFWAGWGNGDESWMVGRESGGVINVSEFDLTTRDGYNLFLMGSARLDSNTYTLSGTGLRELYIGALEGGLGSYYQSGIGVNSAQGALTGLAKSVTYIYWNADGDGGRYVKLSGNLLLGETVSANETVTGAEYGTFTGGSEDTPRFTATFKAKGLALTGANAKSILLADGFSGLLYRGNDKLTGTQGNDYLDADAGNDQVNGGAGADTIYGGEGNDKLLGGEGNDSLRGGNGNDNLNGDAGNDTLSGGEGNDIILGGAGNDVLVGWRGNDQLTGGAGSDIFKFYHFGQGNAVVIKDFKSSEGDKLKFVPGLEPSSGSEGSFTMLASGFTEANLAANAGAVAGDANDYLLFDTRTGKLYYDADGNGTAASAQLVATLTGVRSLSATDIAVVGADLLAG